MLEVTPLTIPALAFSPLFNLVYSHVLLYIRVLASMFYKSSVLIVVAFNVERYICVVHPFSCHQICTGRTSRLAITGCFVISFFCSVQWPICYEVRHCYDHIAQDFLYVILLSENETLKENKHRRTGIAIRIHACVYFFLHLTRIQHLVVYRTDRHFLSAIVYRYVFKFYYRLMDYMSLVAFNVLPIFSLLVMNCMIITTLRRVVAEDTKKEEESATLADGTLVPESSSHRLNPNALLFAVVFMLLICVGPQAPARLLFDLFGQYHPKAIVYTCVSQQASNVLDKCECSHSTAYYTDRG
ncbi:hypothetical protein NECAME_08856 [Necator americanus]|uniref:G-protein coupled receptors family 1 profile domain-containing protein n=1 Tax=Necator americanus TaxID=51031 RepID=W2TH53_NECAM|nr:hypothetical protein NECAME_08856 [Necator americanus]ETN80924.1 hypothetical protein NECAME_08856 [Necator americanus]